MWHVAEREEESEKGCRMRRTRIGGCVAVMFTCMPLDEREGGGGQGRSYVGSAGCPGTHAEMETQC